MPTEVLAVVGEVSSNYLRGRNPNKQPKLNKRGEGNDTKLKKVSRNGCIFADFGIYGTCLNVSLNA